MPMPNNLTDDGYNELLKFKAKHESEFKSNRIIFTYLYGKIPAIVVIGGVKYDIMNTLFEKFCKTTVPKNYDYKGKKLFVTPGASYSLKSVRRICKTLKMKITKNYDLADVILTNNNVSATDHFSERYVISKYVDITEEKRALVTKDVKDYQCVLDNQNAFDYKFTKGSYMPTSFVIDDPRLVSHIHPKIPMLKEYIKQELEKGTDFPSKFGLNNFKNGWENLVSPQQLRSGGDLFGSISVCNPIKEVAGFTELFPSYKRVLVFKASVFNVIADINLNNKCIINELDFFYKGQIINLTEDLIADITNSTSSDLNSTDYLNKMLPPINVKNNRMLLFLLIQKLKADGHKFVYYTGDYYKPVDVPSDLHFFARLPEVKSAIQDPTYKYLQKIADDGDITEDMLKVYKNVVLNRKVHPKMTSFFKFETTLKDSIKNVIKPKSNE